FRKALELDPRNFQLSIYAGETLGFLRRFPEAHEFIDRALQIAPDTVRALVAKVTLFQAEGRLDDASKVSAQIKAPNQGPLEIPTKSTQFFYERRYDAVIAQLQPTLTPTTPGEPIDEWKVSNFPLLGYCQQRLGKTAEAHSTYTLAVHEIKPSPSASVPLDH